MGQALVVLTKHICGNVFPVKTWWFAWTLNF